MTAKEVFEAPVNIPSNSDRIEILYIRNTGVKYDGFFGLNGYNMEILGYNKTEKKVYKLNFGECDSLWLRLNKLVHAIMIDIPSDFPCLRMWSNEYDFIIDNRYSTVSLNVIKKDNPLNDLDEYEFLAKLER